MGPTSRNWRNLVYSLGAANIVISALQPYVDHGLYVELALWSLLTLLFGVYPWFANILSVGSHRNSLRSVFPRNMAEFTRDILGIGLETRYYLAFFAMVISLCIAQFDMYSVYLIFSSYVPIRLYAFSARH